MMDISRHVVTPSNGKSPPKKIFFLETPNQKCSGGWGILEDKDS